MITIDTYDQELNILVDQFLFVEVSSFYLDILLQEKNKVALQLLRIRKSVVSPSDIEKYKPLLISGYLQEEDIEGRIAFFALEQEIASKVYRQKVRLSCERYTPSHEIFNNESRVWEFVRTKNKKDKNDGELIDYKIFSQSSRSANIKYDNSHMRICNALNPWLPEWINKKFPDSKLYVRIDPFHAKSERAPELLTEELKIDPDKVNWQAFAINKNILNPYSECLYENTPLSLGQQVFWDANINKIHFFQVSTNSKGSYQSFMIEELDCRHKEDGVIVGRCLHFDVNSFSSENIEKNTLNHLDFSINYYLDQNMKTRLGENLAKGKITDADFRVHTFRVENIPIGSIPVFCLMLFHSRYFLEQYFKAILSEI